MKWTGSKQISRPDKKKWTQGLSPKQGSMSNCYLQRKQLSVLYKGMSLDTSPHLRLWPMPMSVWAAQNTLPFLLLLCDFWLVLPLHLGKHFLAFCFFFLILICVCWFFSICCFARCCSSCLPFFQQRDIEA